MRLSPAESSMSALTPRPSGWSCAFLLAAVVACQSAEKSKKEAPPPSTTVTTPSTGTASTATPAQPSAGTDSVGNDGAAKDPDKPSAKEVREVLATPVPQSDIDKVVNPKGLAPYSGPT